MGNRIAQDFHRFGLNNLIDARTCAFAVKGLHSWRAPAFNAVEFASHQAALEIADPVIRAWTVFKKTPMSHFAALQSSE
jgi:hypothetical protein